MPGYYLFDHPPRRSQGAPRTTWGYPPKPSGVVAVHDTEGVMDDQGDDWGAENTAAYIVTRTDPGSYHEIHDGDSVIVMAPDDWMTWNVAADQANGHNWGISAACRTADWNPDAPWTRSVITSMGRSIAAFWQRNGYDVNAANRWITRDEANRRTPGLILHGTWQPGDRSDAWATHPRRADLDRMLIDAIRGTADTIPPPETSEEDDDMVKPTHAYKLSDGSVYTTDGLSARWLYGGTVRTLLFPPNDPTIEIVSELNRVDSIEFLVTFEGSGNIPAGSADKYAKSHPA